MSIDPREALDQLVASGQEPGAGVAVVRDGVVEVDHSGGTRDGSSPWTSDTLVMTFSVAKPFAALTVLDAVAEGALDLDTRVTSVWPAYGSHGKESTTVRHLLSHQAGLPDFPGGSAGPGVRRPRRARRAPGTRPSPSTPPAPVSPSTP